jgi:hypothetical protein
VGPAGTMVRVILPENDWLQLSWHQDPERRRGPSYVVSCCYREVFLLERVRNALRGRLKDVSWRECVIWPPGRTGKYSTGSRMGGAFLHRELRSWLLLGSRFGWDQWWGPCYPFRIHIVSEKGWELSLHALCSSAALKWQSESLMGFAKWKKCKEGSRWRVTWHASTEVGQVEEFSSKGNWEPS